MFHINTIALPAGKTATIAQVSPVSGPINLGDRLGPQGAAYRITIPGMGTINLIDKGNTVPGPATWSVQINNNSYWFYEGEGQMAIAVDATGKVTISGGAGTIQSNVEGSPTVEGNSITITQGWGSYAPYANPNVYPGDTNGNPVTPQNGVPCHLWGVVQNNGTEEAQAVIATFYICIPSSNVVWPAAAHGSGSIPTLAPGATARIMCTIPWIPDSSIATHQCIVGVASCLDCPAPPTVPGTPVPYDGTGRDQQVGLHNVFLTAATNRTAATTRHFTIHNAANDGYVQITREPLADNIATLKSKGIDPLLPEAPQGDTLNIFRQSDGKALGSRFNFAAGETHELYTEIGLPTIEPGTAAIYHVQQFEKGQLVGGVSQIITHS
jgi:hypothetical protein